MKKKKILDYKLTDEDFNNLNWGEIEKKMGIDATKAPPKKIKRRIQGSVFAREFKWFTKEDLEKKQKENKKILKKFNKIIDTHS